MRDKERTVNRLRRQLRLVSESGNRRLNSTQNSLQSNQQILAELRDEYEEFYAVTGTYLHIQEARKTKVKHLN